MTHTRILKEATIVIGGTILALMLAASVARAEYVRAKPGNEVAKAEAYCNMVASGAERGYFAFGNANYVAGAALGSAIGNMIRVSEAKKNCIGLTDILYQVE